MTKKAINRLVNLHADNEWLKRNAKTISKLTAQALSPVLRRHSLLCDALKLDADLIDFEDLPPLIREILSSFIPGTMNTLSNVNSLAMDYVNGDLALTLTDSDVHPEYKLTTVLKDNKGGGIVRKFRTYEAESFLQGALRKFDVSAFVSAPRLVADLGAAGYFQEFVERIECTTPFAKDNSYSAGRFTALSQILGLNDLHENNLFFTPKGLMIVDGETLFQKGILASQGTPATTHLFHHNENQRAVHGAFSRLCRSIESEAFDSKSFLDGYRSLDNCFEQVEELLPNSLQVRSVPVPTPAYSAIIERCVSDNYYRPPANYRLCLEGKLNATCNKKGYLADDDASHLSRGIIPYHVITLSFDEMREYCRTTIDEYRKHLDQNCGQLLTSLDRRNEP